MGSVHGSCISGCKEHARTCFVVPFVPVSSLDVVRPNGNRVSGRCSIGCCFGLGQREAARSSPRYSHAFGLDALDDVLERMRGELSVKKGARGWVCTHLRKWIYGGLRVSPCLWYERAMTSRRRAANQFVWKVLSAATQRFLFIRRQRL